LSKSPEKPISILQLMNTDTMLVALLWAQIRAMQIEGYDVRCACPAGPNERWLTEHGVKYFKLDIRRAITPWADLKTLWRLYKYLRREDITVVFTHTPKAALLGQLAAKLARVPVIMNTLHGFYFHDNMPWTRKMFYVLMASLGSRCATMTLSQNHDDVETAKRYKICHPDRIRFLGNGIDLKRFDPARFDEAFRRKKREEFGISENELLIFMVARLVREKGYIEMFKAIRKLRAKRSDFHFIMVALEEPYRGGRISPNEFKRYDITDCTTRLHPRADIDELLACMDVFVLPSWREGFPRSAIEATAMGVPIVTTDIRGCREVVTHDENGLIVPVRDPDALAAAIETLLDNPDMRERMGKAGYDRARREFDENTICKRVMDSIAEEVLAAGIPRPTPRPELADTLPEKGPFVW
jgi:glycosyltransferase involved in cell wall biosynthesis